MPVHVRHHHFYRAKLLFFFTADSKPTYSEVVFTVDRWFLIYGLPSRTPDCIYRATRIARMYSADYAVARCMFVRRLLRASHAAILIFFTVM